MRITRIIERTAKVDSPVRNATTDLSEMTVTLLAVVTDQRRDGRPVIGYAFNSFGRYACGGPLRDRFIPRLLAAPPADLLDDTGDSPDPGRIQALLLAREKRGGHAERSMALGTLDLALWDIAAKLAGQPLYRLLADRFGTAPPPDRVPVYAAGGFYAAGDAVAAVRDEVGRWRDAGFVNAKIKAGAGAATGRAAGDHQRIQAALAALPAGGRLALDLSCAFDAAGAAAFAAAVAPYGLWWLEEPCDPLDYAGYHAAGRHGTAVAGGENLFAPAEFANFLRYADLAGRVIIQPDPPLAYGLTGLRRIVALAGELGVGPAGIFPHGGNMMALHAVAGLGLAAVEAYPGLFGAFGGFSREIAIADGLATLPTAPGIGFEEQPALYHLFSDLVQQG